MDGRIVILEERVMRRLNHEWSVRELADSIGVSESYLQRLFKDATGVSPIQYIRELRLRHARDLLEDRRFLRIQEICIEVGINDPSHFTRDFAKKYGSTPTTYRKRYWESYRVSSVSKEGGYGVGKYSANQLEND